MRDSQVVLRGLTGLDVIGGDVCEVAPPLDPSGITCIAAANLMFGSLPDRQRAGGPARRLNRPATGPPPQTDQMLAEPVARRHSRRRSRRRRHRSARP